MYMFIFLALVFAVGTILLLRQAIRLTRTGQKGRSFYVLAFTCASASLGFIQSAMVITLIPANAVVSQIPDIWKQSIVWTWVLALCSFIPGLVTLILDDVRHSILGKDQPIVR